MPMKEVLGVIPGLAKYAFLTGECELARFPCVLPIVPSRKSAYVRQRTPYLLSFRTLSLKHGCLCKLHPGIESKASSVERNLSVCCPLHHLPDKCNEI